MIKLNQTKVAQIDRVKFKEQREEAVANIVVETASGRRFDGDEKSQERMARAIVGLSVESEGSTQKWKLADNSWVDVGLDELREALKLAGLAQTAVWNEA